MTVYNDMMRAVKKRRVDDRENNNEMANRYLTEKQKEFEKRRKKGTEKKEVRREEREGNYPVIEDNTWKQEMLHLLGPPGATVSTESQNSSSEQENDDVNTTNAVGVSNPTAL